MDFFSNHRSVVQQIERQNSDKVTFVWLDIAVYQEQDYEQLMRVAEEMKVQTAPALVLMDSQRQVVQTWQGNVNPEEVNQAIEQVVK
ncbi:hypothetical protein V6C27_11210 [Peptococcaceae bacterium 1198_IL3148]